jgi:radical SAM protein with 4Fe4S-binding SPASM domain
MIKQSLLRFGGYKVAQNLYTGIEYHRFMKRFRSFLETGKAPLPNMVVFETTQRCNLHCKMCYQDRAALANRGELTLDQMIEFFERNPYLKKVALIGGEIFIRPDLMDLIRYLDRTRDIVISTNGTLIGYDEINELRRCSRIITICFSLDGPKITHESISRVSGSYDKTVKAIEALAPIFPVTVTCVIQDDNLEILPEFVDLCADMGVKKLNFELERIYLDDGVNQTMVETKLIPDDIPILSKERRRGYPLETLQGKVRECQDRGKKAGIYVTFDPPFLMDEIAACYVGNLRSKDKYICQRLFVPTIAPDGNLITCFIIRKPFGNILDAPFNDIWNSESANTYRRQLVRNNLTPLCENCPSMIPCGNHHLV